MCLLGPVMDEYKMNIKKTFAKIYGPIFNVQLGFYEFYISKYLVFVFAVIQAMFPINHLKKNVQELPD